MNIKGWWGPGVLLAAGVGALAACGSDDNGNLFGNGKDAGATPDGGVDLGVKDGGAAQVYDNSKTYNDFPTPVIDSANGGAPASNIAALFGAAGAPSASAALCVFEPEPNVRYPRNWITPRLQFSVADADSNVLEVRIKADNQTSDLIVYASIQVKDGQASWVVPEALWDTLRFHSYDKGLSFSVRTAVLPAGGASLLKVSPPAVVASGILPVSSDGNIVYFSAQEKPFVARLRSIDMGTETARPTAVVSADVLTGTEMKQRPGRSDCVGCHSETPDDNFMMVGTQGGPSGSGANQDLKATSVARINSGKNTNFVDGTNSEGFGGVADFALSAAAKAEMATMVGVVATTPKYWEAGKHYVLGFFSAKDAWDNGRKLKLVNLDGAVKELPNSDPRIGAMPVWSHDGRFVYYTSTKTVGDGRLGSGYGYSTSDTSANYASDIYAYPFNDGAGGAAVPLAGAAAANEQEFYPALSPDDKLIAFNHARYATPLPSSSHIDPNSKVRVMRLDPSSGNGAAASVEIEGNNAVSCPSAPTDASKLANRWPKWAPRAKQGPDGKLYYYVVFSSWRRAATLAGSTQPAAQLYVSPVVFDPATGVITSYGAMYLRSQHADWSNHTPVWTSAKVENNPAAVVQ